MSSANRAGGCRRGFVVLAAVVLAAAVFGSTAGAAPVPGGTFVRGTWWPTPSYLFLISAGGGLSDGLTGLGCPLVPEEASLEAQTSQLTYAYHGWFGPVENADTNPSQQALLRTRVSGTVQDIAGNTFSLAGDFLDMTTHFLFDQDLLFDGVGKVTLAGRAGVVVGTAELRLVNGPLDYAFVFTSVQQCTVGAHA